jgi:hypothetical protein
MSLFPPGLEPVDDLEPAAWVREGLKDRPGGRFRVRDLVPPVFDAYARILHQTRREDHARRHIGTWAERASGLGRELGSATSWWDLMGTAPFGGEPDPSMPDIGCLTEDEVRRLVRFLDTRTASAACWFGIWEGWGFLSPSGHALLRREGSWLPELLERWRVSARARREVRESVGRATIELPGRSYLLVGGTVEDATRFIFQGSFQSPSLWWADDRSWFVHTEIDGMSTYVGGAREMVDRLVGEQVLESFEVGADDLAVL